MGNGRDEAKNMLSEAERKFIEKRRALIRLWKWVGTATLLCVITFWGFMFFRQPLLFNPFHVARQIENGDLTDATLALLALIGSLGFFICGFLLIFIVLFLFVAMSNERKYLRIIDCLREEETMGAQERRTKQDRRTANDRRKWNDPDYNGPERRTGGDRRTEKDRRKVSDDKS